MATIEVQFARPYRSHSTGAVKAFPSGLARELIRLKIAHEFVETPEPESSQITSAQIQSRQPKRSKKRG